MISITQHEIYDTCIDGFFGEVDQYTFTEITAHVGGHELHFKKQGAIRNPTEWVIQNGLKEIIHHCGHYELIPLTNCNEDEYHLFLCEDDFYDEEIQANGGRDIRRELLDYNNDLCYNSDIFFTIYNFLKGKLTSDEILEKYEELLDVQEFIPTKEFYELTEKYDNYIHKLRQLRKEGCPIKRPITLINFILKESTKEE